MIFYFSGTGNSLHAANQLVTNGEALISIADMLRKGKYDFEANSGEAVGFVFPVYFYSLPSIVLEFVSRLKMAQPDYVYAVITCGGGIGQAGAQLSNELKRVGIRLDYVSELLMPDNSMLFYQIPTGEKVAARIEAADARLSAIAEDIASRKVVGPGSIALISDLMSIAYKKSMGTAKFYAEDSCIGCGKCAKSCPMDVIQIMNGKPVWIKEACCKCSACINQCPTQAIQYGKHTKGRNRYHFPK